MNTQRRYLRLFSRMQTGATLLSNKKMKPHKQHYSGWKKKCSAAAVVAAAVAVAAPFAETGVRARDLFWRASYE